MGLGYIEKMSEQKIYDLEERTFQFAKKVRFFIQKIPKSIANNEDAKQLVRASGSVAANYIEANEKLSDKDFDFRIKVCKKEAKESGLWLRLIKETNELDEVNFIEDLINESIELRKIFNAILKKRE
jgi:four helix bundle protein